MSQAIENYRLLEKELTEIRRSNHGSESPEEDRHLEKMDEWFEMSLEEQTLDDEIRRFARIDFSTIGREEEAVGLAASICKHEGGPSALSALAIESEGAGAERVVTFALRDTNLATSWPAWTALLLPQWRDDASTVLNILAMFRSSQPWETVPGQLIASLLPGFLLHALELGPLTGERALSAIFRMPTRVWAYAPIERRGQLERAVRGMIARVDADELRASWESSLAEFEAAIATVETVPVDCAELELALDALPKPSGDASRLVEKTNAIARAYLTSSYYVGVRKRA